MRQELDWAMSIIVEFILGDIFESLPPNLTESNKTTSENTGGTVEERQRPLPYLGSYEIVSGGC
jgi:hypothetical protein